MTEPLRIASVIVEVKARVLDRPFDYTVPSDLVDVVQAGQRVQVPFGRQTCYGYIIALRDADSGLSGDEMKDGAGPVLKPLQSIVEMQPVLTPEILALTEWLCYRYACSRLEAIQASIPGAFRGSGEVGAKETTWVETMVQPDELAAQAEVRQRRAPKQASLLRHLAATGPCPIAELGIRASNPAVKALEQSQLIRLKTTEVYRLPEVAVTVTDVERTLTSHQQRALRSIESALGRGTYETILLHGVTGSGKTEVYLRAIQTVLAHGGTALVLVPEIALTPQLLGRFTVRFGSTVAVMHSGLSAGERRDEWTRIRRGEAKIVVGVRSAVFAPLANVSLIVIDEEHEQSYKQEEAPRYDAREVADWRARHGNAVVVLGSATPSIQSMYRAEQGEARLVSLPTRVNGRPLPPVTVVDMREEHRDGYRSLFSRAMTEGLVSAINCGAQAILFLNRRGYAAFILCRQCGQTVDCPHCDISLTVHRDSPRPRLRCHYCQYEIDLPQACPHCGDGAVREFGIGTQQLEQAVKAQWPNWRVLRMDVDTTRKKGAHRDAIEAFLNREADVLLGTQMIAKGLDFPDVAFVGVVAADTMLAVPDYRSAERTFNLLAQVVGRAGRSELEGHTVIQTFQPEHYAIQAAARHDYGSFYRRERQTREWFLYPPFAELAVFVAVHGEERWSRSAAERYERELRRRLGQRADVQVLGATPSGVARIEDQYRHQVVIKYAKWEDVRPAVVDAYQLVYKKMRSVGGYCTLDVNAGRI